MPRVPIPMNLLRVAASALVLALAAPAILAADKQSHGFDRLYRAAAASDAAAAKHGRPGATPETVAVPAPVQAVMRVKRLADGSYGVVCETEPVPPGTPGPAFGGSVRRERR